MWSFINYLSLELLEFSLTSETNINIMQISQNIFIKNIRHIKIDKYRNIKHIQYGNKSNQKKSNISTKLELNIIQQAKDLLSNILGRLERTNLLDLAN